MSDVDVLMETIESFSDMQAAADERCAQQQARLDAVEAYALAVGDRRLGAILDADDPEEVSQRILDEMAECARRWWRGIGSDAIYTGEESNV